MIATECRPQYEGLNLARVLLSKNIPCTMMLDSAMGYAMGSVSFVMVGAEAVVENGGIINRIGTYTLAIAAKAHRVPLYVAAESYKFHRIYPLHQRDMPGQSQQPIPFPPGADVVEGLRFDNPNSDYTVPPLPLPLYCPLSLLSLMLALPCSRLRTSPVFSRSWASSPLPR